MQGYQELCSRSVYVGLLAEKVRAPEHKNRGEAFCMRRISMTLEPEANLSSVITASEFTHKYGLDPF